MFTEKVNAPHLNPEFNSEHSLDSFTQLLCFDISMSGRDCVAYIKWLVDESNRLGYRMASVDNGKELGLDADGKQILNNRGSVCRITFVKL